MKIKLLLLLFTVICITGQINAQSGEKRDVGNFTRIDFRIPGNLHLRQGSSNEVQVKASSDMLSRIETRVEDSKLVISFPEKGRWNFGNEDIDVYVTVVRLEGLYASGSGDVKGESKFKTDDLDLKVSGSGTLRIEVAADGEIDGDVSGSGKLEVRGSCKSYDGDVSGSGRVLLDLAVANDSDFSISGSGRIEAKGRTKKAEISISGSGKVLAADFEAQRCEVRISGSGSVEINVNEELNSRISGSGSVSYRGNPSKVNNHSSGSGSVRRL